MKNTSESKLSKIINDALNNTRDTSEDDPGFIKYNITLHGEKYPVPNSVRNLIMAELCQKSHYRAIAQTYEYSMDNSEYPEDVKIKLESIVNNLNVIISLWKGILREFLLGEKIHLPEMYDFAIFENWEFSIIQPRQLTEVDTPTDQNETSVPQRASSENHPNTLKKHEHSLSYKTGPNGETVN